MQFKKPESKVNQKKMGSGNKDKRQKLCLIN